MSWFRGRGRQAFRKYSHHRVVLLRTLVATDNVIVQDCFDVPALLLRHPGEMAAAVQPLLFAGHGQENNGGGKLQLAQDVCAFQADGGPATIVVRAGSVAFRIEGIAIARIVVSGHQHDAFCVLRIGALEDRINIGDFSGLWNPFSGRLGESIGLDFKAAAAILGITLEF